MKNLISMTDFVFYIDNNREFARNYDRILAYAKLLKQPLELWMFVPCELVDGVWVVLEKPKETSEGVEAYDFDCQEYQQTKERCLFEGFEICIGNKAVSDKNGCIILIHGNGNYSASGKQIMTIEDLLKYNLQLTQTAIKQIEL